MRRIRRAKRLTIRRKGYHRKGYTRKGGIKVKPTRIPPATYKIRDIGAPGRGRRVIRVKPGRLKRFGYSTKKSASARHKALDKAVKTYGPTKTWRMLHAQVIFRKRRDGTRRVFKSDREYIRRKYKPDVAGPARRKWMRMSPRERAKAMPG